jgi:hypothetical protein
LTAQAPRREPDIPPARPAPTAVVHKNAAQRAPQPASVRHSAALTHRLPAAPLSPVRAPLAPPPPADPGPAGFLADAAGDAGLALGFFAAILVALALRPPALSRLTKPLTRPPHGTRFRLLLERPG